MKFGILLLFANANDPRSDAELFRQEMRLGKEVEALGFDSVWVPEHHFDRPYCVSPDPLQALTYLAATTSTIKLGTAAIILPWWNDPMRLAERISMLDALSDGRLLLGFGRGLAKVEYDGFGIAMDDSRERFNEAADMVLDGLEKGFIEHNGKHFQQERRDVFPAPEAGFRDRLHNIAMSPESTIAAAEYGGVLMCFNYQYPIEQQADQFNIWRDKYVESHNKPAPPPVLLDFAYCHRDPAVAEKNMKQYLAPFFSSMVDHYGFDKKHWGETTQYKYYQNGADLLREAGREAGFEGFYGLQWKGTPEAMIEQMRTRIDLIGDFDQMLLTSFGGMPYEMVQESLELITTEVLPEVRKIAAEHKAKVSVSA